ncbi:MAG: phosphatase PAP2 family protein [Candidatus Firestonebacteria bacterium]|nr:phosphatase PAP2 family protein [Candidatus Firestonebacteria bacterium]
MENILKFDQNLFIYINNNLKNPIFDVLFYIFNYFGNWWYLAPICLYLIYLYDREKILIWAGILVTCGIVSGAILHLLKWYIIRPRPLKEFEVLINTGKIVVYSIGEKLKGDNSFPSGHTQTAFTAATFLYYFYNKKYSIYLILFASMVGLARIYSGVHFPIDVIAGAFIGILPTMIICKCLAYSSLALLLSSTRKINGL